LIIAVVAALVFALDRVTKTLVQTRMESGTSIPLIPGLLRVTYIHNAGAAFGLLQHQTIFFVIVTLAVVALIVFYGGKTARSQPALAVALGLMLGGALGNLLDRLRAGTVVDFIDFYRIWPFIFNIADASIVVGGLIFAWMLMRQEADQARHPNRPADRP